MPIIACTNALTERRALLDLETSTCTPWVDVPDSDLSILLTRVRNGRTIGWTRRKGSVLCHGIAVQGKEEYRTTLDEFTALRRGHPGDVAHDD